MNKNGCEAVLLLSGGIDSTTLLAELRKKDIQVHALTFHYGQRHRIELEFARENAAFYHVRIHRIIKIDYAPMAVASMLTNSKQPMADYRKMPLTESKNETYVPGRNLLMLSHAAAYAEAKGISDIYFAANKDDGKLFPDCRPEFFAALNQLLHANPHTVPMMVHTPFIGFTKAEVIIRSQQLGVRLDQTLSCYSPKGREACNTCLSCVTKSEAIRLATGTN